MIFTRKTIPNFLAAIGRTLRAVWKQDEPIVASPPVRLVRTLRCRKNDCGHYVKKSDQCGLCTCVVELKVTMAAESCPDSPQQWREQTNHSTGLFPKRPIAIQRL